MATGTLIAESLRLDAPLSTPTLRLRRIVRRCVDGLPPVWTFVEFEVDDTEAGTVADGLTAALAEPLGGYCDVRTEESTYMVFHGRVFRYARGDAATSASVTTSSTAGIVGSMCRVRPSAADVQRDLSGQPRPVSWPPGRRGPTASSPTTAGDTDPSSNAPSPGSSRGC